MALAFMTADHMLDKPVMTPHMDLRRTMDEHLLKTSSAPRAACSC